MWKFSYTLRAGHHDGRRLMATYQTFGQDGNQLPREPKSSPFVSYGGVVLAILAGVISSFILSIPKYMVKIPPLEHTLLRSMGIMIFSLPPLLQRQEIPIIPKVVDWPVLFLRGMLLYASHAFRIITVYSLQLSKVGVLMAIFPVYITVFANQTGAQQLGPAFALALIFNLVGLGFVTNLPTVLSEARSSPIYMIDETVGIAASLAAGLSFTLAGLLNAKTQHLPNRVTIFNSGIPGTLTGSLFLMMTRKFSLPSCGIDSSLLMILVVLVVTETAIQVFALKMEEKGPVSLCSSISMIACTCLWQISLDQMEWYTILGVIMVLCSIVLTYLHLYLSLPESDHTIFSCLTTRTKDEGTSK